jgi:hypothetical protein
MASKSNLMHVDTSAGPVLPLTNILVLLTCAKRACWMARASALANNSRGFVASERGEFLNWHTRHIQVDINAVENGAGDALLVFADHA